MAGDENAFRKYCCFCSTVLEPGNVSNPYNENYHCSLCGMKYEFNKTPDISLSETTIKVTNPSVPARLKLELNGVESA